MNRLYRSFLLCGLLFAALPCRGQSPQAAGEENAQRVQYQLVRPDEKTPEDVKPEEHNPFESESEAQNRMAPGDTEENRVRDKLLKLPVVGTKRMADGRMRVLLGDIILETGGAVPPVLAEQLVELRVKNITSQYIELAWQEKRATGLPPKLMVIPINISPKVRYQMFGQSEEEGHITGTNATLALPLRDLVAQPQASPPETLPESTSPSKTPEDDFLPVANAQLPRAAPATASAEPVAATQQASVPPPPAAPLTPEPQPAPPPSSPAVESVVRMLFGNPTPAPK